MVIAGVYVEELGEFVECAVYVALPPVSVIRLIGAEEMYGQEMMNTNFMRGTE